MSLDHFFRISIIDAGLELIRHFRKYPTVSVMDAIKQLQHGPCNVANLNYDAVLQFTETVGWDAFCPNLDRQLELRETLMKLAVRAQPFWARASIYGRTRVRRILSVDQEQCLHYAGLLSMPPDTATIQWWDTIANHFRVGTTQQKLEIGRTGEELSLHYELQRLRNIGVLDKEPKWISIEDNSVGYDLLSYDYNSDGEIIEIRIEIKSTNIEPIHFIITSNEWSIAQENPQIYYFHIWDIRQYKLWVLKPESLLPHMPTNIGVGKWLQAEIRLDKLSQSYLLTPIVFDINDT